MDNFEKYDITDEIGRTYQLIENKTMLTRHNLFTLGFWACVFIVGGLQALQGSKVGDFTTLISLAGFLEHTLSGNTGTPTV